MELASVSQIREIKNAIKEEIAKIDKSKYSGEVFGQESEYTYKGLLGGVDCLMTDITALTKAPSQFLKISTYSERSTIITVLTNIQTYLESPAHLWQQVDALKIAVRPYHIRYTQERLIEFDTEISEAVIKKQALEDSLRKFKESKVENDELLNDLKNRNNELTALLEQLQIMIDNTSDKNSEVIERIELLDTKVQECSLLIDQAKTTVKDTNIFLEEAEESTNTIKEFETTVEKREKQVKIIDERTLEYRKKIDEFETERQVLNQKADTIIKEALKALSYNTARGLSASFQTQVDKIENSKYWWWLVGAGCFLFLTLGIGLWIVLSGDTELTVTIGRFALTPLTITGAVFCANQYIRQKNVIEDYSYKTVLAKSIVGFSEQLNNGQDNTEEYKHYIKMALAEIHKDPLRKRAKLDKDVDGGIKSGIDMVIDTAQKIIGLTDK